MNKFMKILALGGMASLASMAFSGSALAAGPTCEDGPIQLGSVSTVTGVVDFSDAPNAAEAYFAQLNEAGGINGCQVEYTLADDRGDPQVAAQAARDLIDNKQVVALAGGASLLDCAVNAGTYNRTGVLNVSGLGVDAACFNSPSVAPVNVGPFTLTTAMLYYASEVVGREKICTFFYIIGGTQEAYTKGVTDWEKLTGKKLHLMDLTLPVQGDLTPYVIRAREAGCEALLTNQVEPGIVQWVNTAEAQGVEGIDWLFLAPGYADAVANALADTNQPVYVGTEWEPYTVESEANQGWIDVMTKADLPRTAFSQGGYLAAQVMTDVIKSIDGPVTRESVKQALENMEPLSYPIAGTPYIFGKAERHSPMRATKIMALKDGEWKVLLDEWLTLPELD
ncbi:branched-chain amino acid transport system substrate-binding protein [Maritalea mobilis]|uniref:Branched-chain amino acid transport system substrate-binding protein n=1 Tax=Maritalea mobilis TaxID=483324 RepID=A0A4R6VQZ1_9HYPH|nr:ABC transporter substrate-binding protein [Maritalea mobilis]TDQ62047.1 branched-chain amino acid transport system substrate-binding protein [Maritalea mobilis]